MDIGRTPAAAQLHHQGYRSRGNKTPIPNSMRQVQKMDKRADLRKAVSKVETTNKETQESRKQAIEGKYGSRGLKYLLKIRQDKLLLRGRLQEMGIVQNGECIICAQKATEEEKPIEVTISTPMLTKYGTRESEMRNMQTCRCK